MKRFLLILALFVSLGAGAQINTDQVLRVGQNALYFEDYMLSIQYFNRVIQAKPYLAQPYLFRAIAKVNLEDYNGAEADASKAIELNPYLTDAWEVRGVARQNLGRDAQAIGDYDHALELLPRNRQLLFNKALAQTDTKDYAAADTTFSRLLTYYPGFDSGYLGRARLRLVTNDTVGASADIEKALSINKNAVNAYIMRADIAISRDEDFEAGLRDMDEAIRLQPRLAGLYVNRAYLRYRRDDYYGAMADFDYALTLDPINRAALFNRSMLLAEAGANDKALVDLDRLVELDPGNVRALYNRALINKAKGRYKQALEDINKVMAEYPELSNVYYIRGDIYRETHDFNRAQRDLDRARALARAARAQDAPEVAAPQPGDEPPVDEAAREFATLLTVDDNADIREEYNNTAIRGKVQDKNLQIEPEGWMELSYYMAPSELRPGGYYIKEVDDLNSTRILRYSIVVTPAVPMADSETADRHFKSIDYYNSYLASHTPRAIDYIGRAMDFMTVRDYARAIQDLDRALALTDEQPVALLLRAQAGYRQWQAERRAPSEAASDTPGRDALAREALSRKGMDDVVSDLRRVTEISPRMAEAWYNLGLAYMETGDYTSALEALNQAIELKPEMGEAWYNRGYVYLKLGNRRPGIADLSRAGELGIVPAYNLIKRISH